LSELTEADIESLTADARAARRRAYAPYSDFHVGAAVRGDVDPPVVLSGGNVENAVYGLSMCAERVAVFRAVAVEVRRIAAIAVAGPNDEVTWPCGACRQVLHEFGPDMLVVAESASGRREQRNLSDLLPEPFGPADLR
jgi:cytidine deaminase